MTASYLQWPLGKPGMVASHSYKHNRQCIDDGFFINTRNYNFPFGVAAVRNNTDQLLDIVADGAVAAAFDFIGVFQDSEKYLDQDGYKKQDLATVFTMGDIWCRVDPAVTIKPYDRARIITTAGSTKGFFTNAAAATTVLDVPNRELRFLTAKKLSSGVSIAVLMLL